MTASRHIAEMNDRGASPPATAGGDCREFRSPATTRVARVPAGLVLTALVGIAILLRTQQLTTISFCFDEACSWKISGFPAGETLDAVGRDAHPPVYYFLLKGWRWLFGTSVLSARSFSVVWGAAGVAAAWWLVRIAVNTARPSADDRHTAGNAAWLPLTAACLAGISALSIELSHEARPYTLGMLLALLSGACLLQAVHCPERVSAWLGFAVTVTTLTLTHYFGLFTAAAMWLFGVWELGISCREHRGSGRTRSLALGLAGSLWLLQLAWAPWFSTFGFQRSRADVQFALPPLSWEHFSSTCWRVLSGGSRGDVWPHWTWLAVAVWVSAGLWLMFRRGRPGRLIGLCALLPLLASAAYGLTVRNLHGEKYLSFAQVYLVVGCAMLAGQCRPRWIGRLGLAVLAGWMGLWAWKWSDQREFLARFPGTQGAVAYLNQVRGAEAPVIVSSPFIHTIVQQYAAVSSGVVTQYSGDHRGNILSGPALRESDYAGVSELLASRPETVWAINVSGLFGRVHAVRVPEHYAAVSEHRFPERYRYPMELIVVEYRRTSSDADSGPSPSGHSPRPDSATPTMTRTLPRVLGKDPPDNRFAAFAFRRPLP